MSQGNELKVADARKLLVERIAASRYLNRSARLQDLLAYLSERVLEGDAGEIHEQEVGHKVFGRPANYDTASDNIVRVHASMLRKRLEQYFAAEGAAEPVILEIPRGNYAPVFRERAEPHEEPEPDHLLVPVPGAEPRTDRRIWILGGLAVLFACSTAYLLVNPPARKSRESAGASRPTVELLWSQIFQPNRVTDIVLDDAAVGLYQELTGRSMKLSEYFDRDYLRRLPGTAAEASLDERLASAIVLRRQTSFAGASFLWRLFQMPGQDHRRTSLHFARDYSFREVKANNALLLGNSNTNPWIEPFEPKLRLRWVYDKSTGVYNPLDTASGGTSYQATGPGESRESYTAISLLPNLSGTGNVLIISGTGGSAINAGADFLADEQAVASLRRQLPASGKSSFPYFEALIKVKGRSSQPRDATIVLCRVPPA
jgi:hypothetical protein